MRNNPQTLLVVMPAYNSQATIAMAIESILEQSYKNLRLVIVDDASTDSTLHIAKMYLKDPRVSIYHNKQNMGAYYSRNVGLAVSKDMQWSYFTTHDADDISFEHRYLMAVRVLRKPRVIAVQDKFRRIKLRSGKILGEELTMAHAVFNRVAFDRIGYFEQVRFGADWEYWTRVNAFNKLHKYHTHSINHVLGEAFIHENNLTTKVPLNSTARNNYIKETRRQMRSRNANADWYRGFEIKDYVTEKVK